MSTQRTAVPVKASPETIFALIERDRTEFRDDETERSSRLNDAPFGPGYRFRRVRFHGGKWCEMTLCVTAWDSPRLFEEEWRYDCRASEKVLHGRQRFEIETDHSGTILIGTFERHMPGLMGVFERALGVFCSPKFHLLPLVQRAEAVAHADACPV